jgi:hypothetical protein
MRKHFWWISATFLILSIVFISWKAETGKNSTTGPKAVISPVQQFFEQYVNNIYQAANLQQAGLSNSVFQKALTGYLNLKATNKLSQTSSVITVVDFTRPSREKRMWIIDLLNKQLLLNTWVAHGEGSGDDMANQFSNQVDSHQSSLGFYLTDNIYVGKHGKSLKLDGLDEGFNDNARAREIVVHAAGYVCQHTIDQLGRLGRSFGCPAVSPEVAGKVINTIKGRTMLYIHGNIDSYNSKYLDENVAASSIFPGMENAQGNPIDTSLLNAKL